MSSISTSLQVATASVLVGMVPGLVVAWNLAYGKSRNKGLLDVIAILPVALPPTVIGYYLLLLIGRSGPIGTIVTALGGSSLIFTPIAAVIASVLVALPLFIQSVRTSLESIPPEIREAASIDGASHQRMALNILLPLAWPGIAIGIILAFARSLGEFGATIMVAGNIPGRTQTIPMAIYSAVQSGQQSEAAVLAGFLTMIASVAILLGVHLRKALVVV